MNRYLLLLLTIFCLLGFSINSYQKKPSYYDLFPLTENMTWHYNVSFRADGSTSNHKLTITNKRTEFEGEMVASHKFHNGDVAYYRKNIDGVFRLALYSNNGGLKKDPDNHFLIRFPLKIGNQWEINSKPFYLEQSVQKINAGQASLSAELKINPLIMKYEISAIDEQVRISTGKYSHCVRVTGIGKTTATGPEIGSTEINVVQTDWYAPSIGLIKSERRETTGLDWAKSSLYTMELDKIY